MEGPIGKAMHIYDYVYEGNKAGHIHTHNAAGTRPRANPTHSDCTDFDSFYASTDCCPLCAAERLQERRKEEPEEKVAEGKRTARPRTA